MIQKELGAVLGIDHIHMLEAKPANRAGEEIGGEANISAQAAFL